MSDEVILLVGHGSREQPGNEEFLKFCEAARPHLGPEPVETCFIELATPLVPESLDRCVALGARRVIVLPVILLAAGHVKVELPHELDEAKERHPGVAFLYGRHIGLDPLVIDIVNERLARVEAEAAWPAEDTAVLVVGRGSSDPDANSDLYKLTRLLWESRRYPWIEPCFIGVTNPSLPEGLARCRALGARRIIVVPYFLFTGVLIPRIHRLVGEFVAAHPGLAVRRADYLNGHPKLFRVLRDRKSEAMRGEARMNCALCKYRVPLPGHEHAAKVSA
ncbi:MAG: sirohydrochlorin chelatase [candidate division NC10 bacterium]|nr:sirohydrochlorin chelatase [Candidatus Rokubacteria bacterium]MBI2563060.1 sirohydrochlorin chelatase [candidate division NC10 bacterium]